ncbi:MAG: recombination mediator RecR [Bacteroidetes bacterium]|nr:recombination mediator RecR [Bacteroidota bacterium]MDA1120553.1 recombination mediator RecR [Bacteroidota bacterium]
MQYPSKLIEDAVSEVSKLPGIGKKTALRLVLHLLKQEEIVTSALSKSLQQLRQEIRYCATCFNISDTDTCNICASHRRDKSIICVVEDIPDVLAIENTGQFNGLYHVLGGIISPMNGIGPEDLNIDRLIQRGSDDVVKEVIMALSATMEGDTTSFYLTKRLKPHNVRVSVIARGVPVGGELEYADEITLGRSIVTRSPYNIAD